MKFLQRKERSDLKVYVTINNPDSMNDYLNLDAFPMPGKTQADVSNLDKFVDDGEANLIVATDIIDYFTLGQKAVVVQNYVKKLAHGGSIILGGVELSEAARFIYCGADTQQANALLYSPSENHPQRKSLLNVADLAELMVGLGLEITRKQIDGLFFIIEGRRP